MKKFSIIVPIFNTKREYLEKCIHSVFTQTFKNYELILVNDGSTNCSTNDCLENYRIKGIKNLKIINQENRGVSAARNMGIINSEGEYLLFLDADDFLNIDCLERLALIIKHNQYDLLFFKYMTYFSKDSTLSSSKDNFSVSTFKSKMNIFQEIINPKMINENVNYGTPWGKIIKRELVIKNNIFYEIDLPRTQDRVFMFDCCKFANEIGLYNYSGYVYNSNEYSVCARHNKNLFEKLMRVYHKFITRVDSIEYDLSEDLKHLKSNFYFETLQSDIFHKDNKKGLLKKIEEAHSIYRYNYHELFKDNFVLNCTSNKRRMFIYLFRYHLGYFVYFMYYFKSLI